MIGYKPDNFSIRELVHPDIIESIGIANSWLRLDEGCLRDLQVIRMTWGKNIYINRLSYGLDSRGLRPPNDEDGSFYSSHKQGKAFDLEDSEGDNLGLYNHVRGLIEREALSSFNTLEDFSYTVNWVHVAKMNTSLRPYIVKP